jgi:hypothetical protein
MALSAKSSAASSNQRNIVLRSEGSPAFLSRTRQNRLHRQKIQAIHSPQEENMKRNAIKSILVLVPVLAFMVDCGSGSHLINSCPTSAVFSFTVANVAGDTFTQLLGINNSGKVAGYHGSGADATHPNQGFTLVPPSTFTSENFPNSVQTQVIGINSKGDTSGFYVDSAGVTHGFTDVGGAFTTVDNAGTTFNQLLGLNDMNQAVGYFQDANAAMTQHPYMAQGTQFTMITTPGVSAQATGINNNGDISGFYVDSGGVTHGYVIPRGKALLTIDFTAATFTQALGLNNKGLVAGTYNDAAGAAHGFLYDIATAKFESLDAANGVGTTVVNGLNDVGQIVGFYVDQSGNTNGFIGNVTGCTMLPVL